MLLVSASMLLFAAAVAAHLGERRIEPRAGARLGFRDDSFSFRTRVEGLAKLFLNRSGTAGTESSSSSCSPRPRACSRSSAVVMNNELLFNQFGLDRSGIRRLLTLPIEARELVLGRLRGFASLAFIQAAGGVLPLALIAPITPLGIVLAVTSAGTFFSASSPQAFSSP